MSPETALAAYVGILPDPPHSRQRKCAAEANPVYSLEAENELDAGRGWLFSRFEVKKERIMKNGPVRVGIIGSQFQADCHAAAIGMIQDDMSVVAVASPTASHAQALADRYKVPRVYSDYKELAKDPEIEAVSITAPNALHCEMTLAMAQAGKHVICEKPLCVTLDEADKMIAGLPRQRGAAALCRVALLHSEVRQGERDGRLRRLRQSAPDQAKREALRSRMRNGFGM